MPEIEKTKEETGWLKVTFALLVVIDVSLIGWIAQNSYKAPVPLLLLVIFMVIMITWAIIEANRHAYKKSTD